MIGSKRHAFARNNTRAGTITTIDTNELSKHFAETL